MRRIDVADAAAQRADGLARLNHPRAVRTPGGAHGGERHPAWLI
jgi:hypothetical protein